MCCLSNVNDLSVKFYQNDVLFGGNSIFKEKNDNVFPPENYIVKKTISDSNSQNSVMSSAKPSVAKTFEHKSTSVHSTVSHQKTNVITSSKKDDDEWESF
jgi:hypothetical protein